MVTNEEKIIEFLRQSNAIEGVYDEDSLNQALVAWKYLIAEKRMSAHVMLKTHKILMLHQRGLHPDEKGYFRKCEVTIGGRYGLNYALVPDAIEQLCKNINDMIQNGKKETDILKEKIAKVHHVQYEKVHPFMDGNGRTGRMFMNWERLKVGLDIEIIWEDNKYEYYKWFV